MKETTKRYVCKITKKVSEQLIIEVTETITKSKPKTDPTVKVLQKVVINNKKK